MTDDKSALATDTAEDPRAEPLARALHPGAWWDAPGTSFDDRDKADHRAEARRLLAVADAADAASGIRRVTLDEAIERAARRDFDRVRVRTIRYGYGLAWERAPEVRRQAARNRVREIITAALGDAS